MKGGAVATSFKKTYASTPLQVYHEVGFRFPGWKQWFLSNPDPDTELFIFYRTLVQYCDNFFVWIPFCVKMLVNWNWLLCFCSMFSPINIVIKHVCRIKETDSSQYVTDDARRAEFLFWFCILVHLYFLFASVASMFPIESSTLKEKKEIFISLHWLSL